MKKIIGALFALAMGSALAGTASATPIGLTGTGLPGITPADPTVPNVVHVAATDLYLNGLLGGGVVYIGRLADGFSFLNTTLQPDLVGASLGGTGLAGSSGTWTFTAGGFDFDVVAVEIDATPRRTGISRLYTVDVPGVTGNWDTSDFGGSPDLNYLDFYGVAIGPADVPEPMSLMLLGGGLAGLGFARKKKRA